MSLNEELEKAYNNYKNKNYQFDFIEGIEQIHNAYFRHKTFVFPGVVGKGAFLRDVFISSVLSFFTLILFILFLGWTFDFIYVDNPTTAFIVVSSINIALWIYIVIRYQLVYKKRYLVIGINGILYHKNKKHHYLIPWKKVQDVDIKEDSVEVSDHHYVKYFIVKIVLRTGEIIPINLRFISQKEFASKELQLRVFTTYFVNSYKIKEKKT